MKHVVLAAMWAAATASGADDVQYAEHRAEVVVADGERLYFHDQPRPCPARGPCAWRRQTYLVVHDRVDEDSVSNGFSHVTFVRYEQVAPGAYEEKGRTSGWVRSDGLCLYPPMRKTRAEPVPALVAPGRKACPMEKVTRTVEGAAEFYNGAFRSRTSTLSVTDATPGELTFTLKVDRGECRLDQSGTAFLRRHSVFGYAPDDEGCRITFTFDDDGAQIGLTSCASAACEGVQDHLAWRP